MNTTTYWHFNGGAIAGDEDGSADSIMLAVDQITGITPGRSTSYNTTSITIWFTKASTFSHIGQNATKNTHNGCVTITTTDGKQKEVMKALASLANSSNNKKSYITIADDRSDDQATEYAHPDITNCETIVGV